ARGGGDLLDRPSMRGLLPALFTAHTDQRLAATGSPLSSRLSAAVGAGAAAGGRAGAVFLRVLALVDTGSLNRRKQLSGTKPADRGQCPQRAGEYAACVAARVGLDTALTYRQYCGYPAAGSVYLSHVCEIRWRRRGNCMGHF